MITTRSIPFSKKHGYFAFFIFCCVVLQITVFDYLKICGVKPDLFLLCVALAGLFFETRWALIFSAAAGACKDILGVSALGVNTLFFPAGSYLILLLSKKISTEAMIIRVAIVFLLVLLQDSIIKALAVLSGGSIPLGAFVRIVMIEPLYTAVIAYLTLRYIRFDQ